MFEAMWIRGTRCREVMESAWDLGGNLSSVQLINRLRNCKEMLKSWNWREFGNVNLIIKQKRENWEKTKKKYIYIYIYFIV